MRGVAALCFCNSLRRNCRQLASAHGRCSSSDVGKLKKPQILYRHRYDRFRGLTPCEGQSRVTRDEQQVIRHTSHVTHHTSHVTRHEPSSLVIHIFRSCSASNPPPNLKPPSPRCARCSSSTLTTCWPAANLLLLLLLMRSMLKPSAAREKQSRRACWCRSMVAQHLKGNCYNFSSRHKIM